MNKFKRLLALLLAVLTLASTLLVSLSSCKEKKPDVPPTGDNNDPPITEEPPKPTDPETYNYTVNIQTEGGMVMAELPVLIYEFKDGAVGDLIDYCATNEKGTASFEISGDVTGYAIKIDSALPEGCSAEPYYRLVGSELNIAIKTGLVTDSSLSGKYLQAGNYMYDFTVTDIYGKRIKLSDELANKEVVILNFWYVDCSACQLEFPYMSQVYAEEEYNSKVSIIALNPLDEDLSIRAFAEQMGFEFNVAKDTAGLASAFNINAYPTTVVIDRYGMISLVEVGALPSARAFKVMFDHYTNENYVQAVIPSLQSITPVEKPDVQMPSSDEIKAVFGDVGGEYRPEAGDENSWPFIISEYDGQSCIKPSNSYNDKSERHGTYAILYVDVVLEAGEAVAFDYFSSTELYNDQLYVMVDDKDIFRISGITDSGWETCYAYVAEEAGTYELAFCYIKDTDIIGGDDSVYLKNIRKLAADDIDSETYIFRYASTNLDKYGEYTNYAPIFLGDDGYYHVNSKTGPILFADLMGKTHFADDNNVYTMASGMAEEDAIIRYCSYASNSQIYGLCPVTEELKNLLEAVAVKNYGGTYTEGETWLEFCCYYDSYGTTVELEDPIKGLAPFSAYETILSDKGATDFPNAVTYDRVIMPRGLLFKFVPSESGVYLVTSNSEIEVNGWIFRPENVEARTEWIVYDNVDRLNTDYKNVYMMAYLEAGKTYYIDVAYYDVYQYGTINFRVERMGNGGCEEDSVSRFSLASPGYFTYYESEIAGIINKIVAGGIDVKLGDDGIYRADALGESILYADFTLPTPIFSKSLDEVIENNGFNFKVTENDLYVLTLKESAAAYRYYFDILLKEKWGDAYETNYELYKVDDVLKGKYHGATSADKTAEDEMILAFYQQAKTDPAYNSNDNFKEFLRSYWDTEYYDEYYALYQVDDVLNGITHGKGEDLTDVVREYVKNNKITVGTHALLGEIKEGDERIGCLIMTEELAGYLQQLMDKYTFADVENSWTKLCYYHEFFGPDSAN